MHENTHYTHTHCRNSESVTTHILNTAYAVWWCSFTPHITLLCDADRGVMITLMKWCKAWIYVPLSINVLNSSEKHTQHSCLMIHIFHWSCGDCNSQLLICNKNVSSSSATNKVCVEMSVCFFLRTNTEQRTTHISDATRSIYSHLNKYSWHTIQKQLNLV